MNPLRQPAAGEKKKCIWGQLCTKIFEYLSVRMKSDSKKSISFCELRIFAGACKTGVAPSIRKRFPWFCCCWRAELFLFLKVGLLLIFDHCNTEKSTIEVSESSLQKPVHATWIWNNFRLTDFSIFAMQFLYVEVSKNKKWGHVEKEKKHIFQIKKESLKRVA